MGVRSEVRGERGTKDEGNPKRVQRREKGGKEIASRETFGGDEGEHMNGEIKCINEGKQQRGIVFRLFL